MVDGMDGFIWHQEREVKGRTETAEVELMAVGEGGKRFYAYELKGGRAKELVGRSAGLFRNGTAKDES